MSIYDHKVVHLDKIKSDLYKGKIKLYNEGANKVNKTFRTV